MRISNPKLFNGQHLATREDITKWLSGGVVTEYGDLQIPVSGIVGLTDAIKAAEHTHIAGNGINISSKDASGQITFSAVVKEGDLHLGLDASGIQTFGLATAAGNIISANTTVAENLTALDAEIGKLSSGNYIAGDVVASDLTRLDTQVKANFDAITGNTANVGDLTQLVSGAKTSLVANINDFHEYVGTVPSSDMSVIQYIESKAQALEDLIGTVQGQALGIKDGEYIYFGTETVGEGEDQKDLTVINGWDVNAADGNSIEVTQDDTAHSHVIAVTAKQGGAIDVNNGLSVNVDGKTIQIVDNQLSAIIPSVDVPVTEIQSPSGSIDVTHDGTIWNIDVRVKEGEKYLHIDEDGAGTETVNLDVTEDGTYVKVANTVAANLTALDDAIADLDGIVDDINLSKVDTTNGYASSYALYVNGDQKGDIINIPKDQFLKGAEIVEGIYVDGVFTASKDIADEQLKKDIKKYIHFTFEIKVKDADLAETSQEKHIYLDIQDLCDVYTGGKGITVTADNKIDLNVATSGEIGGVKSGGDISVAADGTVSVLSARFADVADVAGKVENALTAFGKAYDGSAAVTVSGQTGTEKYITYSQAEGVFTVGAQGLDVADDGNYVKADNTVAANLTALDDAVGELSDKFDGIDHKTLTAFGKDYDTTANVTISGKTGTEKYITYSQAEGVFTVGAQGFDVTADGNYIKVDNTVAANLTALDTNLKTVSGDLDILEATVSELSDKFDGIDHKTLTIGSKTYDTSADVTVTAADLDALTGVVAGNAGIAVSEKADCKVSVSAVVKEGDLHLSIGENGIQTDGLVTADGNIISANVTVATNLEALDAEIGELSGGTYISGDVVASDLKRLDTQVKANADAIGKHGDAIKTAITFEEVSLSGLETASSVIVEGRIMQVFDDAGWVYPEVKFTTTGGIVSSTVTITEWDTISAEDKTALSGLSGLVSKKVIIAE